MNGGVRWYRGLGFRLALLMAGTMLAFDYFSPAIYRQVLLLLGHPDPDKMWVLETDWIREWLLEDAERLSAGHWQPAAEASRDMSLQLAEEGVAFAWLDLQGRVVSSSDGLPFAAGSSWPSTLETHQEVTIPGDPAITAPALCIPISLQGEAAGTYVSILTDRELHAEFHEVTIDELIDVEACNFAPLHGDVLLTEQEFEVYTETSSRIVTLLSIAIVSIAVLLIALVTSRVVTRRLRRLAAMAATPLSDEQTLPGPFPDTGGDEIGSLARSLNSLRRRVADQVEGMARRDSERREWIAQVSHDLRTPLTALLACLDRSEAVLAEAAGEQQTEKMKELLSVARMDARRVHTLADDLLEIARLDAVEHLDLEPVPPGELVRQTVRALGPLAEASDIELGTEIEPGLPIPKGDGRRLLRAMENLLRNAIEHARRSVVVAVARCAGGLRFEVRDDGPGLPVEGDEVILGRALGDRKRDDSAGLGLVVTRRVAEAHGGRIGAANRAGGGAVVWLVLPSQES